MIDKKRYMLDTNTVSYIIKGNYPDIRTRLLEIPMSAICISVVTEAELLLGVAKKPKAKHLPIAVKEFLLRVDILPWASNAAKVYANLRATCEKEGKSLGNMDMLIAAHAKAENAILVTSDRAFYNLVEHLNLEDWINP